tara:strand:+ start:450 stop:782 length:333 start_codon:yes stop_codon:yes gene_type:complete
MDLINELCSNFSQYIIFLAKNFSENQFKEIINKFSNGKSIDKLSGEYNSVKSKISRHLKIDLGDKEYKEILIRFKARNSYFLHINFSNRLNNISNEENTNKEFLKTFFYF